MLDQRFGDTVNHLLLVILNSVSFFALYSLFMRYIIRNPFYNLS